MTRIHCSVQEKRGECSVWYNKINITFNERVTVENIIPKKIFLSTSARDDIFNYYTSSEFPIQNFHRQMTDILYYHRCYSDGEFCPSFAIAAGDSPKYQSVVWCATPMRVCSFNSGEIQQQLLTWGMIWSLSIPNNFVVYGHKHKVWVLVFLVRTRGTSWDQIWADLAKFSILQQTASCTVFVCLI